MKKRFSKPDIQCAAQRCAPLFVGPWGSLYSLSIFGVSVSNCEEVLTKNLKPAIAYKGYALVDILQPCVSFNKVNTHAYYKKHVYELEAGYDPTKKLMSLEKSMEGGDRISIGILYAQSSESYEQKRPAMFCGVPIIDKIVDSSQVK